MANFCTFTGRLVKDATLTQKDNNQTISRFTLAVRREYSTDNQTDFIDMTAYGRVAEFVGKHGKKGMQVYVGARFQSYLKQDASKPAEKPIKGYAFAVDKFEILSTKKEMEEYNNEDEMRTGYNNGYSKPKQENKFEPIEEDDDLSIPF